MSVRAAGRGRNRETRETETEKETGNKMKQRLETHSVRWIVLVEDRRKDSWGGVVLHVVDLGSSFSASHSPPLPRSDP